MLGKHGGSRIGAGRPSVAAITAKKAAEKRKLQAGDNPVPLKEQKSIASWFVKKTIASGGDGPGPGTVTADA